MNHNQHLTMALAAAVAYRVPLATAARAAFAIAKSLGDAGVAAERARWRHAAAAVFAVAVALGIHLRLSHR